jgi:hypothetical protein
MSFTINRLEDEPIHIINMGEFSFKTDLAELSAQVEASRAQFSGPFFEILDVRNVSIPFSDVVLGFANALRTERGEIKKVPVALQRQIFIVNSDLIRRLVGALGQTQYGSIPVEVVGTFEEAMTIIHTSSQLGYDK